MAWWPFCAPWARKESTGPSAVLSGLLHHPGHYGPLTSCSFPGPPSAEADLRPNPHLMLWCSSKMGLLRMVTSSVLATEAAYGQTLRTPRLSSGPRFATESRKGQARSSALEAALPGRLRLGEAAR